MYDVPYSSSSVSFASLARKEMTVTARDTQGGTRRTATMTDHAFIPGVLCSCCVEDEFRHFFREAELRVMGKPALPTQQQRYVVLAGLLLSERCRWRAVLAPTSIYCADFTIIE